MSNEPMAVRLDDGTIRFSDGTIWTAQQLLEFYNSPEAKEIFKKDREDRINSWCKNAFEKLGTKNSLILFKSLLELVDRSKWDALVKEDKSRCKEAMERLLVIFDSEDQPLLSDDGFDVIVQELCNELEEN